MKRKQLVQKVREQGRKDFTAGKPITAYYEMLVPGGRHTESLRSAYECGWRGEKAAQGNK